MKVKIIRKVNPLNGRGTFDVFADDSFITSITFNTDAQEGSAWHEEKNRLEVMEWAKRLESVKSVDELEIKETVYETPINKESIKM